MRTTFVPAIALISTAALASHPVNPYRDSNSDGHDFRNASWFEDYESHELAPAMFSQPVGDFDSASVSARPAFSKLEDNRIIMLTAFPQEVPQPPPTPVVEGDPFSDKALQGEVPKLPDLKPIEGVVKEAIAPKPPEPVVQDPNAKDVSPIEDIQIVQPEIGDSPSPTQAPSVLTTPIIVAEPITEQPQIIIDEPQPFNAAPEPATAQPLPITAAIESGDAHFAGDCCYDEPTCGMIPLGCDDCGCDGMNRCGIRTQRLSWLLCDLWSRIMNH